MKRIVTFCLIMLLCSLATACYKSCASGDPLGLFTHCPKETRDALMHPKPLFYDWQKNGVSQEKKIQDWIECGGRRDGSYTTPDRLPEEKDDFAASKRKFYQIQRCMLINGYNFTGKCDNQITKATPGCGASELLGSE